jgi:hypothetical protein
MMLHRLFRRVAPFAILCLFGTSATLVTATPPPAPGKVQIAGWVYVDRNNDGDLAFSNEPNPEYMIGGVEIRLYDQSGPQDVLLATTLSDDFGRYFFNNLSPGTYGLRELQPVAWVDGLDTTGSLVPTTNQPIPPSASTGTMIDNGFDDIVLTANLIADFFLFGERGLAAGYVSKRYLLGSYTPPPFAVPEPTSMAGPLLLAAAVAAWRRPRRRG